MAGGEPHDRRWGVPRGDQIAPEVADVHLGAEDAIELAELLGFVGDCLSGATEAFALALDRLCGRAYTVEELGADLARFALLVGGDARRAGTGDDR